MIYVEEFEHLRSRFMYDFADQVYGAVEREPDDLGAFDDDECFADLAADVGRLSRPHKTTLLHTFIGDVCRLWIEPTVWKDPCFAIDYFEQVLSAASIKKPRWLTERQIGDHRSALMGLMGDVIDVITPSVFFVLFSDREFLRNFQARLAEHVAGMQASDFPEFMIKDGVLRRCSIPKWLKQGIFYRDRGRCQLCMKDLTGTMRSVMDLHYDHIIPLASSGSNDPTNFQLLCERCNKRKGRTRQNRPPLFAPYWK